MIFQYLGSNGSKLGLGLKKTPRSLIMTKDGVGSLKSARELLEKLQQSLNALAFTNG